jgi:hypothetical protein
MHEAPRPVLEAWPTGFHTRVGSATIIAFDDIGGAFASCGSAHDIDARTAGSETCFHLSEVLSQPSRSSLLRAELGIHFRPLGE